MVDGRWNGQGCVFFLSRCSETVSDPSPRRFNRLPPSFAFFSRLFPLPPFPPFPAVHPFSSLSLSQATPSRLSSRPLSTTVSTSSVRLPFPLFLHLSFSNSSPSLTTDNAEIYSNGQSEIEMGRVFKELEVDRSQLVVSTKFVLSFLLTSSFLSSLAYGV